MKRINKNKNLRPVAMNTEMWSLGQTIVTQAVSGNDQSQTLSLANPNSDKLELKNEKHEWQEINWKQVETKIKDLQEKIVTATLKNNIPEIYKLQRRILQTFEGRALAVRRVITNKGGKTAGIDETKWLGPQDYWNAILELDRINKNPLEYEAQPVWRVMIPKPNSEEKRPLGIPTMLDRAVQAMYQLGLDPVVETKSDPNSFGFRKNRSTHDAVAAIRSILDKKTHPRWILEIDIRKCFDKIDHQFLMDHTPICHKDILRKWLKAGILEELNYIQTDEGTPQGSIISPILCNVALNGLEKIIKEANPLIKGISQGVHIIRYADDMIVTSRTPEIAKKNREIIAKFLEERGLQLHPDKTKITHIKEGFDFLGFNFCRKPVRREINQDTDQETVLIIKPNEKGINNIMNKIKKFIKKDNPMEYIVKKVNPILRGWAEHKRISYHSQPVFIKLEDWIYKNMMRWARARSSKISISKVLKKHLFQTDTRKWNWGATKTMKIINLGEVSIMTYPPLKLDRNPYIKENIEYFNKRREKRIDAKFKMAILEKYKNLCPICGETLHNGEPIELHHIVPRKIGGKYSMTNIQPLHRICHQQITFKRGSSKNQEPTR